MSTVCAGSTFGEKPPMRDSSAGSGPSSAASGMPCTLPLERRRRRVHVAVRVDPDQADRQIARLLRPRRPRPPTDPAARLWSPPSTSGIAPSSSDCSARLIELLADLRDVADVFLALVAQLLRFRDRRGEIAFVDDGVAERGDALAEAGDAKRRRPHVDAAPAAAEVERHADDVNGLGRHNHFARRQLHRHRHAFAAAATRCVVNSARLVLDRGEEVAHLVLLVDDVVREEQPARARGAETPGRRTACSRASTRRGTRSRTRRSASGSP